ncbi:MAG: ABC transporter permease [Deltaproteobacteria bacterium]|nr:ABC transporter permease [Deltaproteobacteria bacterium]HDO75866.1 ABC transporter permease [Candidatus Poribacteria bacterium]HEX29471.1 ABC transporter permease [Candidatus Poribacteria bacterium]
MIRDLIHSPTLRLWQDTFRELKRSRSAIVGGVLILLIVGTSIAFPLFYRVDPLAQDLMSRLMPPVWQSGGSWAHPLGTDNLGRDVLSRILYGSRVSLMVGFSSVLVAEIMGILLGLFSGYYGGKIDTVIMRVADIFMAYPFMLLTISVIAVLGNSILNLILVLGISDWVTYARTVRGSVLALKEKEFVRAAHSLGTRNRTILRRHIFPNILSPMLVLGTVRVANIIIWESGLSFLGMGVPPPRPTWGRMLAEGRLYITDAWWLVTLPGLAIMMTILAINLFGDGLRDALDPRLRNV